MNTIKISGKDFEAMLRNGLANLCQAEQEINDLNVFPVSDGDTGTNMRFTIENGLRFAKSNEHLGQYLKGLSDGMLLGARGNSGVILSQIFKGIALALVRYGNANAAELRNAFIRGYKAAYETVVCPVEGTILTVTREGIEHIKDQVGRSTTVESMLAMYLAKMRTVLAATPEMLPVLKECGVVDSGAMGYIRIVDGMLKYLNDEIVKMPQVGEDTSAAARLAKEQMIDFNKFTEDSEFIDGYCTEFILQLMNADEYDHEFAMEDYRAALMEMGDSIVVTQSDTRVKVHIHTKKPAKVIAYSQQYGEFLTFKLENMQLQHNDHDAKMEEKQETKKPARKPAVHKDMAIIAVINGDGMAETFEKLGCDYVIEASGSMNASSEEFLEGIKYVDADRIVILPNNGNTIMAAKQAASLYENPDKIEVIETKSLLEGYYVISMDIIDATIEERLCNMREGLGCATLVEETTATKEYGIDEINVSAGDEIALVNGDIVSADKTDIEVILAALASIDDIDYMENMVVFRGRDKSSDDEDKLIEAIEEEYPDMQILQIDGGQEVYHWLIGVI